MTAQRYFLDILQPHVLPLMKRLPGAIFQQDNARPHTASVSQACLCNGTTLLWSARSPDLSPVEHIWDHLGWRVRHLTSLNELEARLFEVSSLLEESSKQIIKSNKYLSSSRNDVERLTCLFNDILLPTALTYRKVTVYTIAVRYLLTVCQITLRPLDCSSRYSKRFG
ncbi:transposable element Tcb2 transposase [Trichonephila clavipes]|uniref:Transposable element Tcb2 transposase n=1 Tax=Trichonephila clavipes TaxID=2585209 RepID=A0A8X6VJ27_TRICX|nr:transposable element Tcb2 transposase [Trichonephila clavipes]